MVAGGPQEEWALGPAERVELISTDPAVRGLAEEFAVLSAITFYPPRAYATDRRDDPGTSQPPNGTRRIVLRYAVELAALLQGTTYRTADVTMTLPEDCQVVAAPGLPDDRYDTGGSRFRLHLDRPEGGHVVQTELIVEIPDDRDDLTITMTCGVRLRRSLGARWHGVPAVTAKETSFTSPVPGRPHAGPAVRLFIVTDLKGFGRRGPQASGKAQKDTADVIDRATGATGVDLDDRQEHGDSLQLTFPPAIDERTVLRAFYQELSSALRQHNRDLAPDAALRLRVAIERGLSDRNSMGWDRAGPVVAARLRDCAQAREALKANVKTPFVLVVSDVLYRDIFRDPDHEPPGTSFTKITIEDFERTFSATTAWLHVADE
jgi:hypothetical protein